MVRPKFPIQIKPVIYSRLLWTAESFQRIMENNKYYKRTINLYVNFISFIDVV